jgi:hypothetical protein
MNELSGATVYGCQSNRLRDLLVLFNKTKQNKTKEFKMPGWLLHMFVSASFRFLYLAPTFWKIVDAWSRPWIQIPLRYHVRDFIRKFVFSRYMLQHLQSRMLPFAASFSISAHITPAVPSCSRAAQTTISASRPRAFPLTGGGGPSPVELSWQNKRKKKHQSFLEWISGILKNGDGQRLRRW